MSTEGPGNAGKVALVFVEEREFSRREVRTERRDQRLFWRQLHYLPGSPFTLRYRPYDPTRFTAFPLSLVFPRPEDWWQSSTKLPAFDSDRVCVLSCSGRGGAGEVAVLLWAKEPERRLWWEEEGVRLHPFDVVASLLSPRHPSIAGFRLSLRLPHQQSRSDTLLFLPFGDCHSRWTLSSIIQSSS